MSNSTKLYFAHTLADQFKEKWEPLRRHLEWVAHGEEELPGAARFAQEFNAAEWGRIAGLWHDLGKYSDAFQAYLDAASDRERLRSDAEDTGAAPRRLARVDHATAGAKHAVEAIGGLRGYLLAFCIASHHTGLINGDGEGEDARTLAERLAAEIPAYDAAPRDLLDQTPPQFTLRKCKGSEAFQIATFCRMLFSCLVDADFLATEKFMSPERFSERRTAWPTPSELLPRVDAYLQQIGTNAEPTEVNRRRRDVLEACRIAATQRPGFFSLTVPTGGGKTLSSLTFALKHAEAHGLRRVIYAIPFTSIIEQNADVFRTALGDAADCVIEHHSNLDPKNESRAAQHASENWDAPLIITTNVQLYESLFASKTSRCRKLHRIARSVIVLDEVQSLPVRLLTPTLAILAELVRNYGCTIVLCSATMPAVEWREDFAIGLEDVRPIIADRKPLFNALERVRVEQIGPVDDETLAGRLIGHEQVLCVVNTRRHAAELFARLHDVSGATFHLSASMCPLHRTDVLETIHSRLDHQLPCRVISTQLIEAGVDVDFPVVYRAMAGLDSIAQAAGRCNREGKLDRGLVFVFETETKATRDVQRAAQDTAEVADSHAANLLGLEAIEAYFRTHYWKRKDEWYAHDIMCDFSLPTSNRPPSFQFRTAARKYRLISDDTETVIIPYGHRGGDLVDKVRRMREPPGRGFDRMLQRCGVSVRRFAFDKLLSVGTVVTYHERFHILENDAAYDKAIGLRTDDVGYDPTSLYC